LDFLCFLSKDLLEPIMIDLYTWGTPNGQKASIMLEETGLPYTVHPVNIAKGEQHTPEYLAINPNGKIPAIIDRDVDGGLAVFESGAILIYLAEKAGRLLPSNSDRAKVLSWVFWQVGGLGPMVGQWGHFSRSAPEKIPYAIERYFQESLRLLGVLNQQLENREYIVNEYSIADIANYSWSVGGLKFMKAQHPDIEAQFPHLKQWIDRVGQRSAVVAGMQVPKLTSTAS
jgi:GST-like protein